MCNYKHSGPIFFSGNIELDAVNVIPEAVSQKSLRIEGKFHGFNVTWDPISNVNYGQVFYEIKISHSDKRDIVVSIFSIYKFL